MKKTICFRLETLPMPSKLTETLLKSYKFQVNRQIDKIKKESLLSVALPELCLKVNAKVRELKLSKEK